MTVDFRAATDRLLAPISHRDLADALRVSVATVRQARLNKTAKAYRNPPEGWEDAVMWLVDKQMGHLLKLRVAMERARTAKMS